MRQRDIPVREVPAGRGHATALRRRNEVHLSPKAFELLRILIQHRSRALAKAELQDLLWPSTFVGETNLATLVAEIRRTLEDSAQNSHFVRTVHRFGYRFVAEIREGRSNGGGAAGAARMCDRAGRPALLPFRRHLRDRPGSRRGHPDRLGRRLAAACANHRVRPRRPRRGPRQQERDVRRAASRSRPRERSKTATKSASGRWR